MKNKMELTTNKQGFQTLIINDEKFESTPDLIFDLPQKLIGKIDISDFPAGIAIRPYEWEDSSEYFYSNMPIIIENLGTGTVSMEIEACRETTDPGYPIGIRCFQALKAEYILTQTTGNPDITDYEIDDLAVHLHYSIVSPADTIDHLIETGLKFDEMVTVKILEAMESSENDIRHNLGLSLI